MVTLPPIRRPVYYNVLTRSGQTIARIGGPYTSRLAAINALSGDARRLYATRNAPGDEESVGVSAPSYDHLPALPALPPLPKG